MKKISAWFAQLKERVKNPAIVFVLIFSLCILISQILDHPPLKQGSLEAIILSDYDDVTLDCVDYRNYKSEPVRVSPSHDADGCAEKVLNQLRTIRLKTEVFQKSAHIPWEWSLDFSGKNTNGQWEHLALEGSSDNLILHIWQRGGKSGNHFITYVLEETIDLDAISRLLHH